jgi:hypothetical protein
VVIKNIIMVLAHGGFINLPAIGPQISVQQMHQPGVALVIGPPGRPPRPPQILGVPPPEVNCIANMTVNVELNNLISELRILKLSL